MRQETRPRPSQTIWGAGWTCAEARSRAPGVSNSGSSTDKLTVPNSPTRSASSVVSTGTSRRRAISVPTRSGQSSPAICGCAQGGSVTPCLTARTGLRRRMGRVGRQFRGGPLGLDGWRRVALMRRGEIWLVDLDPARGSEADRRRPAVIVSNDAANASAERLGRGIVTVVPVTSNTSRVHPFQVLLPAGATGLDHDSNAQAEQVCSVAVERLGSRVGVLSGDLAAALDEALRVHLAF